MLLASKRIAACWVGTALISIAGGCNTTGERQTSQRINDQMDRMAKMGQELTEEGSPRTIRGQSPQEPPNNATTPPIRLTSGTKLAKPEPQVRIVANVGNTPIYESEVRESVNQRMVEFATAVESERKAKEEQFYFEELRKIVERELLLEAMFSQLRSNKAKSSVLEELEDISRKEADRQMKDFRARIKIPNDDDFQMILQGQGVSMAGMRRQMERGFMMRMYLRELISKKITNISVEHASEFKTDDRVKWQDIFISASKHPNREEMKKAAQKVFQRALAGEDFMKLAQEFDQGLGKGTGDGETRGSIRPVEAENLLFKMKAGEINWFEIDTGIHIIRVADRAYAGVRPFDEKTQDEIRRKLQGLISDREYARIVETLWRQNPPVIYVGR
jgi:hypothetical protein